MKPLVSILIPAYNAGEWIAYTLQSAVAQTWPRKEIIVVDDGSTDRTAEIARGFASKNVRVVSTSNQGLSAAVNNAYRICQGDYIQELDADDVLPPDKIERQLSALRQCDSDRVLLSSSMAYFYYRPHRARFLETPLCQDLSPVEWLLKKMGEGLHMQNATWLVSRQLAEAAGPWDEQLNYDQDGEYFTRVLLRSEGTRFVPGTGVFYRLTGSSRLSHIGNSDKKKESLLQSMKLHMQYLQSLEKSDRVRKACLAYMEHWYGHFYPERPDLVAELHRLAAELGGCLQPPRLRWKYAWIRPLLGWKSAKWAQDKLPAFKASCIRRWDKFMYNIESEKQLISASSNP
jgi:glycosyltransferase involved in cell wall biosynthesis